jgi:hypothetical protein
MKFVYLTLALLLLTCQVAVADTPETTESTAPAESATPEKIEAAKRYLETVNVKSLFEGTYQAIRDRLPEEDAKDIVGDMAKELRYDEVERIIQETMVNHFSTEELTALADFYSSEIGRSVTSKFPGYFAEVNEAVQMEAQRAFRVVVEAFLEKHQPETQEQGTDQKASPEQEAPKEQGAPEKQDAQ